MYKATQLVTGERLLTVNKLEVPLENRCTVWGRKAKTLIVDLQSQVMNVWNNEKYIKCVLHEFQLTDKKYLAFPHLCDYLK